VELDHLTAARALVQPIDILGDERDPRALLQVGQRPVGRVRLGGRDQPAPPVVPAPDQFGIAGESRRRGQVLGSIAAPQRVGAAPEGRDAAAGRDAGSGQHGDAGLRRDGGADLCQRLGGAGAVAGANASLGVQGRSFALAARRPGAIMGQGRDLRIPPAGGGDQRRAFPIAAPSLANREPA